MPSDEKLPKPKFPLPWPQPALDPESDDAVVEAELQRPRRKVTGRFPKPGPRHGDQSMSRQEQLDDTQPGLLLRKPSWR